MNGVLVVDKPSGPTSHDVVALVRSLLREEKVGHTGTLDPIATGVLPLVLGRATRLARFLSAADKVYEAEICLGVATDTWDAAGRPISRADVRSPARVEAAAVEEALAGLRGTYLQDPPPYSAKKIAGTRAYALARRQQAVQPAPVSVTVLSLTLESLAGDRVSVRVECSSGFYVRSLAHELGQRLGTGAHLAALRRTRSGQFDLDQAMSLAALETSPALAARRIVPMERLLTSLPGVTLTPAGVRRVAHGNPVKPADILGRLPLFADAHACVRLLDPSGLLLAIGQPGDEPGTLRPAVVLV